MYVAALDLGTTGGRTMIYDFSGTLLASDYQEWSSIYPSPAYVEQDANSWWDSIKMTSENAIKRSGIASSEIVSLSITNQKFGDFSRIG